MTITRACAYEVTVDFVQVVDPQGHKHWLGRGTDLPGWVTDERIQTLLKSDALTRYEVI